MDLIALIYLIALALFISNGITLAKNAYLKQKVKRLESNDLTKWDCLVESKKLIESVDVENDLNIDQQKMWNDFIKKLND